MSSWVFLFTIMFIISRVKIHRKVYHESMCKTGKRLGLKKSRKI